MVINVSIELVPGGASIDLTLETLDEYLSLTRAWVLNTGIRRQMDAFRDGFNEVRGLFMCMRFNKYRKSLTSFVMFF